MSDINKHYRPPRAAWWQGRSDGKGAKRYHEVIQYINLLSAIPTSNEKSFSLLGFACDEGIRRNHGRIGASQGPTAFRQAFGALPCLTSNKAVLYDAGDIVCNDHDLEKAQQALADGVDALLRQGITPIVIGGGHELAWGQFQGLAKTDLKATHTLINFDAHYDLRPLLEGEKGSSGTPFLQIANHCKKQGVPFDYTCIGIQQLSNTPALAHQAKTLGVQTFFAEQVIHEPHTISEALKRAINGGHPIYLSICLDVFAAPSAPGVSAPQPFGLDPWLIIPHLKQLALSGKIATIGIAELSPPFDSDGRTALLAALLVSTLLQQQ